jgi:hypothetical protein
MDGIQVLDGFVLKAATPVTGVIRAKSVHCRD